VVQEEEDGMAHRGVVSLMTAVTTDATAGLGSQLGSGSRPVARHLALVRQPAHPSVDGSGTDDPGPLAMIEAALEELGRKLDELALRQGRQRLTVI
jgi:hypothetical protein